MNIIQDLIATNITPKGLKDVRAIVIHSMWGTMAGTIAWFKNPEAKASAHYLVSRTGEIRQMVKDSDMAWHAGVYDEAPDFLQPNPNYYSIGIELEDGRDANWSYPQAQRDAASWLVEMLLKKYNLPRNHVYLHKDLNPSRRSDPVGAFSFDWLFPKSTQPSPTSPVDDDWTRAVNVFKTYRANRNQGQEGSWEGYANAVVAHDRDFPRIENDLRKTENTVNELKKLNQETLHSYIRMLSIPELLKIYLS